MNRVLFLGAPALLIALSFEGHTAAFAQETSAPEAVHDPNVIVVTGTRTAKPIKDSPVTVRVVDGRELESAGDITAADAVSRVAGVNIETTVRTGQTPQIQGFSSKHVLVLVNGRPANGRLTDDFDLSRIPASSIERIEVLKGASSVLYGSDAIGGVINIITRRPKPGLHGEARVQADTLKRNEGIVSIAGGSERARARLELNHQKAPSFDLEKKDPATTGSAFERNNFNFEFASNPHEEWEISATLGADRTTTEGLSVGAAGTLIDLTTKGTGTQARLAAQYAPREEAHIRMDVGESRRVFSLRDDQRNGDAADRQLDSQERTREAAVVGSLAYLETQETTLGVEFANQELEYNQIGDAARIRDRQSMFLQHEWRIVDSVALVPGLRYDHDSQFDARLSKALALRFDLLDTVTLRASYGEGYRAPSFSELYLNFSNAARGYRVEGNENLEPELSRSYQMSASWQPDRNIWLSLGAFDNRVENLIVNVRTGALPNLVVRYDNVESARNRGLEFSCRTRVASHLTLGLDYMALRARDEQRGRALDGRAAHSGAVQAGLDFPEAGFSSAFTMNLVGKRPFYSENRGVVTKTWSESYRLANLRLAQKLGTHFEMFGGVRNLTNEGQELYNPVPPRSYFAGVGAEL